MNNKPLESFSDLELAKIQGQLYQQLMQIQGNLLAVNQEIDKREKAIKDTNPDHHPIVSEEVAKNKKA